MAKKYMIAIVLDKLARRITVLEGKMIEMQKTIKDSGYWERQLELNKKPMPLNNSELNKEA